MGDENQNENEEPIIRDKRRIDPETGRVRQPPADAEPAAEPVDSAPADDSFVQSEDPDVETTLTDADLSFLSGQTSAEELAAERLADLQRVTAEYANYRKRTEANREVERERTTGDVVKLLLPVLDDLDRAEKHGDLAEGPFVSIAAKLRASVERLGLKPFGAVGEQFDPNLHEAIFQQPNPEATSETIADVVETGYTIGSTLLRAAKVVVSVPA
ncbi:nucleotide exchange factor GrpE [Compostimonas suwonensis]|uniref:Protein GrpE n=1 Tax=Compostimonas suwonensis TaxID=1048394 RepID=A0A2M9C4D6_9MICO|nr:nucleotide exchange factor GrpE [Compostimonas suwonensis]PJJ65388.1 molecular chaperone GrpE [Compostimonas suwonensis]